MTESQIQNFTTRDPFAEDNNVSGGVPTAGNQDGYIHIRIQQRNGRKTLTTVQGIPNQYDLKKIVRACKKEFACNGTVVEHAEYGEVIQLQGDQRNAISDFIKKLKIVSDTHIKVHGF